MTLSNYQYAWNGFTFGAGTSYIVESVEGLTSLPPLRVQDDTRGYIDGMFSGRDFYDARTITFNILIIGDSSHNAQYYFQQLKKNFYPQQYGYPDALGLLQFSLPGFSGNLRANGRVRAQDSTLDPEWSFGYISTTIELYCPDARYYDDTAVTSSGTSVSLYNYGWATSCPVVYIASPSASFTLSDSASGDTMVFANVSTSSSITIDLLNRTIIQGSGTYARNTLTYQSNWISIPANTGTVFSLTAGSMQVTMRNAYV